MSKRRNTGTDSIGRRLRLIGFRSYAEYLASPHWDDVKYRFYNSAFATQRDGKFCCGACERSNVRLSVHHRTYKHLGAENLRDLMAVCDECHKTIHTGYRGDLWGQTARFVRTKKTGRSTSFATSQTVRGDPRDSAPPPWEV